MYSESMSKAQENFAIMTLGIVVHKQYPFFKASPDGIVSFGNERKLLDKVSVFYHKPLSKTSCAGSQDRLIMGCQVLVISS